MNDDLYLCIKCKRAVELDELAYFGPEDGEDQGCSPYMNLIAICDECYEGEYESDQDDLQ